KRACCFSCSWVRYSDSLIRARPWWPGGKGRRSNAVSPPTRSTPKRRDLRVAGPVERAIVLYVPSGSDSTPLGRTAAVVGRGRDVGERAHLPAAGPGRAGRRLD